MVFCIFFAIVAFYDLDIKQINIKTAFFYSFINQLVYIKILKETKTDTNQDMVCKLLKALYSLK